MDSWSVCIDSPPAQSCKHTKHQIKTTARSRMGHATGDKLVYCHEALHLTGKLQNAGYAQKTEKWDSDSDSDQSDEEDLKM